MRRPGLWMVLLTVACSGKTDSASEAGASDAPCVSADLSDPDCESAQAVLRVAVTVRGAPAPAGTTIYLLDCDGVETESAADALGEARFNLAAATYVIWAENPGEGLSSERNTHDLPGCQTTNLDLSM